MWTEEQRARHAPRDRRYPSDLTDAEWAHIAPFIPPPRCGGRLTVEIVKRNDGQKGFAVLPRRWVVERTLAWPTRCRRLARHYETLAATAVAFIKLSMIRFRVVKGGRTVYVEIGDHFAGPEAQPPTKSHSSFG